MRKVEFNKWERYFEYRDQGLGPAKAAAKARLSESTAWRFERGDPTCSGLEAAAKLGRTVIGGNVVAQPASPEAVAALEDFAKFRRRYFGRRSLPWQERAAYEMARRMESPDREFVVVNAPPGSGKSTLFTHDIPVWLIARNRSIRIMIGSRTERQARMYVGRIKKTLERPTPMTADPDMVARGEAFDAEATLSGDFGEFKPEGRGELWRAEALVVRQINGQAVDDKEATVSAWGQDSGFLGGRYDVVVWDDLVDSKNTKTAESIEALSEWWSTEAESRLEPRGVLVLQGQRIAHNDLYRVCLDYRRHDESPKYGHVVYPAHDEERCTGDHDAPDLLPWPNGCLLDPVRLPWKDLDEIKRNNPRKFEVMYQQNDGDHVDGLVDPAWIEGGVDRHGYQSPGCLDRTRTLGEVPLGVDGGWSFVTVDPSPTEWWGVIWWLYDPATQLRHMIDLWRQRMNPEDFLSMDLDSGEFSGLLHEQRIRSVQAGIPITDTIVEVNAAQRWLLAQPHVQKWSAVTGVRFMPHSTGVNKADDKFGVESIGDVFRQGKIRLPWGTPSARMKVQFLVNEATQYPDAATTDLVMSTWFAHLGINNMFTPRRQGQHSRGGSPFGRGARRGMAGMSLTR